MAPMENTPELELRSGTAMLSPDSPQSIGVTNPPKAKGRGAVMPNTEARAPFWQGWGTTPKPVALAGPKGKPAGVLPAPVWMLAGTWKVEAEGVNTPNADHVGLLKAG